MTDSKETEIQLKNKIVELRNKLNKLEDKRTVKELNKYVGKCYKFKNCYSNRNYWFEYLKILNLNKENNLECLCFRKDTNNLWRIEKTYTVMFYSGAQTGWIEIIEQEFTVEWKKMLSEINSYYK